MKSEDDISASQKRVDAARNLSSNDFAVWAHFEERADKLGEQLWSIGSWLTALIGTTLSVPFLGQLIKPATNQPYLQVENRVAVVGLAFFGLLLCVYSYFALRDVREHIESNWRKSGYILQGTWQSEWKGRKNQGWTVLMAIGSLATIAFASLLVLALCAEKV